MRISLALLVLTCSVVLAAPPRQSALETVLGPKAFRDGDVIDIADVQATSPRLEQGDAVTVRGRFRLESRREADLSLSLTQTEGDGQEETEAPQIVKVARGSGEFELKLTIKHRGMLHLTFYDRATGRPIGGVYFGTAEQMQRCANWDVGYYLAEVPQQ